MDEAAKKAALRMIPYGLYLVGVRREEVADPAEDRHAFLGSWVTQTSFEPPMVALAVRKGSHGLELLRASRVLSLNLLEAGSTDVARRFIKNVQATGDAMEGLAVEPGPATGAPVFPDLPAHLELEVREIVDAGGDHVIVVAEIVEATHRDNEGLLTSRETGMTYAG